MTGPTPPPSALFAWTDGLRSLIAPHNIAPDLLAASTPIPTNAWWGNLLAWDSTHTQHDSDPIFANPYVYHLAWNRGLSVSYPHHYRVDGPINENHAIKYYFFPATIKNLILSATEWTTAMRITIDRWDDLGVDLTLTDAASPSTTQYAKTYVSMGNAFTTIEYHTLHPRIHTDHAILAVNDEPYSEGAVLHGDSFVLQLNNGQRWIVFFFPRDQHARLQLKMQHNTLTTVDPFNGVMQVAYVYAAQDAQERGNDNDPDAERKILRLYRDVAGVYPISARLEVDQDNGEHFAVDWGLRDARPTTAATQTSCPMSQCTTHLHFALPHLQAMIDPNSAVKRPELQLWSHTRGRMQAYTLRSTSSPSAQWRFAALPEISAAVNAQATSFLPVDAHISASIVQRLGLLDVLTQEIDHTDWNQAIPPEGSYYFKGKALQKFGTMCLVAHALATTTHPEVQPLAERGLVKLRTLLDRFVTNRSAFPLVYDTVYRGIITSEALHRHDMNVDFGNAVYNDHHYHYGYIITAAAILLHLEQSTSEKDPVRVFVDTLVRDVVTTDVTDPYFPRFRLFNWFLGHSYSHGVTPMADGKDEESTSEEINFLYGLALYGHVTKDPRWTNLATLMLKVNTLAIRTYFLLESDATMTIHPPAFVKNKVTGICFDNKCDYATWFNPARECIHGIQMLPVSPMLDVVRTRQFINEEWHEILAQLACIADWERHGSGWTSLLFSNAAILDPERAAHVLTKCPMDDGLSRAWALFMAGTKWTTAERGMIREVEVSAEL